LAGFAVLALSLSYPSHAALQDSSEAPPAVAGDADITAARQALDAWTQAYQTSDYDAQWRLTHPRIRHWRPRRLWRRTMIRAARQDGALLSYTVVGEAPVTAEQLPCTEQGHCYRPGIRYVMFTIRSVYENAAPPQPEYVAMAELDGDWYFGGGTFLNRPFGETSAIMTEADERRFRHRTF
jgi:hypothetical protein